MILFVLSSLLIDWECSSVLICSSIVTFFSVRFSLAIIYLVPFISIFFCIFLLIAWYYFSHWLSFFLYLFAFCWTFICFSWKFLCHCAFVDLKLDSLFFLFPKYFSNCSWVSMERIFNELYFFHYFCNIFALLLLSIFIANVNNAIYHIFLCFTLILKVLL